MKGFSEQLQSEIFFADKISYKPVFFRASLEKEKTLLSQLLEERQGTIKVFDSILLQLQELVRLRNPSFPLKADQVEQQITQILNGTEISEYGVWVFYPWSGRLVHILDEKEFVELRTNRNKHKITEKEKEILATKKIGIVGLSVGQSVASTIAMERVCGELVIADFDKLELSNLNRIRTGLHNLDLQKTINAAREIAELDPYLKVTCYHKGITEENIDAFLTNNGKLDLLIEECDSLDIKVLSRQKAKEYGIPVLMDTNDRGMLDIERYDLQNEYPLFHGMLGNINYNALKGLNAQQKIPFLLQLIGLKTASNRSKVSLIEMGQSISNFPQLASSVVLGGAIVADVSRRILLDQLRTSGRFYVDVEGIIKDKEPFLPVFTPKVYAELTLEEMRNIANNVNNINNDIIKPSHEIISQIVADAGLAPSSGNDQPWKWFYKNGRVYLFHDLSRSYSFGDYKSMAAYTSIGAAIENFSLSANSKNLETEIKLFPIKGNDKLIATIDFVRNDTININKNLYNELYKYLPLRCTNRKLTQRTEVPVSVLQELKAVTESIKGAQVYFISEIEQLKVMGQIISACDRIRLLHPHGHHDFYKREMRWNEEEVKTKRTGMDIRTLEIPAEAMMAIQAVRDEEVVKTLLEINGAQAFKMVSVQNAITSSAMGLVTMPAYTPEDFIDGGRAWQRQWLKANGMGYAYQPLIAPLYLFPRLIYGNGEGLPDAMVDELKVLRQKFLQLFPGDDNRGEVFLFRLFKAPDVETKTLRLPLEEILFIEN